MLPSTLHNLFFLSLYNQQLSDVYLPCLQILLSLLRVLVLSQLELIISKRVGAAVKRVWGAEFREGNVVMSGMVYERGSGERDR